MIRPRGHVRRSRRRSDNRMWTLYIRQLRSRATYHETNFSTWDRITLELRFTEALDFIAALEAELAATREKLIGTCQASMDVIHLAITKPITESNIDYLTAVWDKCHSVRDTARAALAKGGEG